MSVAQIVESVNEPARHTLDALSMTVVVATVFGYLPTVASILSVVWLSLQIYSFIEKRWNDRKARR